MAKKYEIDNARKEKYDNYLILNKFDSTCKAVDVGSIPSPASILFPHTDIVMKV